MVQIEEEKGVDFSWATRKVALPKILGAFLLLRRWNLKEMDYPMNYVSQLFLGNLFFLILMDLEPTSIGLLYYSKEGLEAFIATSFLGSSAILSSWIEIVLEGWWS